MTNKNEAGSAVNNILATLKDNPKALYGLVGAIVVVAILMVMGGTENGELGAAKIVAVAPGQQVLIKNPNVGNTILTATPKLVSAEEEDDMQVLCRQVAAGTSAVVEEEITANYLSFVKVALKDGECQGKTGWVPKVNITAK
jgi:hypothetical protein